VRNDLPKRSVKIFDRWVKETENNIPNVSTTSKYGKNEKI
jgi:hypothetical protein